jgi:hypothetical protein
VISDLLGEVGTVVVFHGHNRDGGTDGWLRGEQADFLEDMKDLGYSYVVPDSTEGAWDVELVYDRPNADILQVNKLLDDLKVGPPYYFLGHSAGGDFAPLYAIRGDYRPNAIQISNSDGHGGVFALAEYNIPTIFCYSPEDPLQEASLVRKSMRTLILRGVRVFQRNLASAYAVRGEDNQHVFLNTSYYTDRKFLLFP